MEWLEQLLKQRGVDDYDALTDDEKKTYREWLDVQSNAELSIEKLKGYIKQMRISVEMTLATHDLKPQQDMYLKARLKNYILIEALFELPEKARKMIEQMGKGRFR